MIFLILGLGWCFLLWQNLVCGGPSFAVGTSVGAIPAASPSFFTVINHRNFSSSQIRLAAIGQASPGFGTSTLYTMAAYTAMR